MKASLCTQTQIILHFTIDRGMLKQTVFLALAVLGFMCREWNVVWKETD